MRLWFWFWFILRRFHMEHSNDVSSVNLLITQIFVRTMVAPGIRTFMCPPRHRACLLKCFAQKNTLLDRTGFEPMTFWSMGRTPNHWTTEADQNSKCFLVSFNIWTQTIAITDSMLNFGKFFTKNAISFI